MLEPPSRAHELVRPGDERAERTAEPLRETERDRVERASDVGGRNSTRDRCVQHTRAVEMDGELELAACRDERLNLLERPDPASRGVVGVLDRDDPGSRRVRPVAPANQALHLVRAEATRPATYRPR